MIHGMPNKLYVRGFEGLAYSNLKSLDASGNALESLEIYAYAVDAVKGSALECVSGSTCSMYCFNGACAGMGSFTCNAGATCSCDGDSCPTIGASKLNAIEAVAVQLGEAHKMLVNEPLVMLVGAGAIMMILGAVFFLYGRPGKDAYQAL